jgi:hypothetical protein
MASEKKPRARRIKTRWYEALELLRQTIIEFDTNPKPSKIKGLETLCEHLKFLYIEDQERKAAEKAVASAPPAPTPATAEELISQVEALKQTRTK